MRKDTYCTNCKEFGHPSNFRGCKVYMQLKNNLTIKRQEMQEQRQFRQTSFNTFINNKETIAQKVRGTNFNTQYGNAQDTNCNSIPSVTYNIISLMENMQ